MRGELLQAADIHNLELLLLFLLALVVVFAALARRFQTPYPIVLVVGGLALSLLPGIPRVRLNPDVVFLVLLPPLIFATAFHTSWQNMRRNLGTILTLAFGLVGFTVVAVAFATERLLPGFDRRIGFVLGALVASTDAIAASAIARRMRLPQRIIDILEGESLVNDVSALVALDFAVSILVNNHAPSMTEGCLRLLYLALGGIAVGLAAGVIIRRGQTRITDAPIEITLTLVAPYIAYMAAEGIHTSGVMATVATGLYLGSKPVCVAFGAREGRRVSRLGNDRFHSERNRLHSHRPSVTPRAGWYSRHERDGTAAGCGDPELPAHRLCASVGSLPRHGSVTGFRGCWERSAPAHRATRCLSLAGPECAA